MLHVGIAEMQSNEFLCVDDDAEEQIQLKGAAHDMDEEQREKQRYCVQGRLSKGWRLSRLDVRDPVPPM